MPFVTYDQIKLDTLNIIKTPDEHFIRDDHDRVQRKLKEFDRPMLLISGEDVDAFSSQPAAKFLIPVFDQA
jgi:hypothetical protein